MGSESPPKARLLTEDERRVLHTVYVRASNLSQVFPCNRTGEALYLPTEDWETLAGVLEGMLR